MLLDGDQALVVAAVLGVLPVGQTRVGVIDVGGVGIEGAAQGVVHDALLGQEVFDDVVGGVGGCQGLRTSINTYFSVSRLTVLLTWATREMKHTDVLVSDPQMTAATYLLPGTAPMV
ncbi:hypothetical protein [Streptomyces kanamyceticus]|uniref:hypothetical protein n=1 Tax=Streptomyces kanamyceticus TaxID=1967 RepID=UPI0037DCFC58